MKHKKILILIILLFFLKTISTCSVTAYEYDYKKFGTVEPWVKLQDGIWQKPTVKNVTLKVGEPIYIKVNVSTIIDCHADILINGPGKTVTYELVDGPSPYDEWLINNNRPAGWNTSESWIFRPTDNWTNGIAPLNLRVYFSYYDERMGVKQGFYDVTLIAPYISNEIWDGETFDSSDPSDIYEDKTDNNQQNNTPGFEVITAILVIVLVILLFKKKTKKN